MKAILMSIKPENLINILNHNKTLELRKSVPTNFVGWVYLYCTKGKPYLGYGNYFTNSQNWETGLTIGDNENGFDTIMNGKVVARFWFDEYEKVSLQLVDKSGYDEDRLYDYETQKLSIDELLLKTCLSYDELHNFLDNKEYGYALHIKNLEIFDKPMELSEFYRIRKTIHIIDEDCYNKGIGICKLTKAPANWQYVWVKE
jgi:predicted transcriptional regulator